MERYCSTRTGFNGVFKEMIVYILIAMVLLPIGYAYHLARSGRCTSARKLDGKIVIVTGANTGIGKETAKDLAKRGATVVLACRDMKKGESALKEVKEFSGNSNVHLKKLDLSSLESVRNFSKDFLQEFPKLHILVNNAGLMLCPYWKTADGFEMQFGVNHLGHFALTNLLLERLVECSPSRIVNVSSSTHYYFGNMDLDDLDWKKRGYNKKKAYGQSKLANVLFTKELHRRLVDKSVTSYTLHPGAVKTDLQRHTVVFNLFVKFMAGVLFKTAEEGAQTNIYCAIEEGLEQHSGEYFENCAVAAPGRLAKDASLARKLWVKSEELTNVKYPF